MQFTALSMLLAGVSAYNGVRMVPHSSRVVMMSDAPAAVAEPAPVAEVAAPAAAPAPAPAAKPAAKKVEPEEPAPTPLDAALVEIIASKKRLIDAHNEDAQVRLSPAWTSRVYPRVSRGGLGPARIRRVARAAATHRADAHGSRRAGLVQLPLDGHLEQGDAGAQGAARPPFTPHLGWRQRVRVREP